MITIKRTYIGKDSITTPWPYGVKIATVHSDGSKGVTTQKWFKTEQAAKAYAEWK